MIYIKLIDNNLIEMNRKFKQTKLIEAMEACNLNSNMFLYLDTFLKWSEISTDNQFFEKLKVKCDLGKKVLFQNQT